MKTLGVIGAAALAITATASASTTPAASWKTKDMKAAVRALGYPKPHPRKLVCTGIGAADTYGLHSEFRCKATYTHHRVRRFYTLGAYSGGWICAGKTLAACKVLRHGFVMGTPSTGAVQAARGYMALHYNDPQPYTAPGCTQPTTSLSWSFCYALDTGDVNVTVTLKKAAGGYVTTTTARLY